LGLILLLRVVRLFGHYSAAGKTKQATYIRNTVIFEEVFIQFAAVNLCS